MKRKKIQGWTEGADGETWTGKITNSMSRVIDCWSEEKDGGCSLRESTVGTRAERTPAIRSRWAMWGACGDKDFATLLLPEQCSPHHSYSVWRTGPCLPLFLVRGLQSAFSVRKLTFFSQKLSIPLCSVLLPSAMFSSIFLPFPHLTFRHKKFT